jgi:hypothetical protein
MDFTFGVCATNVNECFHDIIIDSIVNLKIPNYEILLIGENLKSKNARCITFDESFKPGWITKKKNILCQEAKYENIVLLHDYIYFHPSWYIGFQEFGNNFDVAMNIILNLDGSRFRDWCLNPYSVIPPKGPIINREFLLPYNEVSLIEKMYISGTYWVAKKQFMLDNPLDENLLWGESEDLKWSEIVNKKTIFKMNTRSVVQCLKYKHFDFTLINEENLNCIKHL